MSVSAWRIAGVASLLLLGACAIRAAEPAALDDAGLLAYAARPWDKAQRMGTTMQLGRHHGVPVVAEFPCADVCPRYTVRIIHYRLPPGTACAEVGGVEQELLVPVAITMLAKTFCIPEPLMASGSYYAK